MKALETERLDDKNFLTKDGKVSPNAITSIKKDLRGLFLWLSDKLTTDDIKTASKTGADKQFVTGTKGSTGELGMWNADGDLVSAGVTKSGADTKVITGTPGTDGNLAAFNGDGDAVDGGVPVANLWHTGNLKMMWGYTQITPEANTPTHVAIDYTAAGFAQSPQVFTSPYTQAPGTVVETSFGSRSATGCDIYIYSTGTTQTGVSWLAIGT